MNVSEWISARLSLRGGRQGSGAGIVIAVTGVALCVIVMEFTLAVVVGFKDGIRDKLLGFDAEISIEAVADASRGESVYVSDTEEIRQIIYETLAGAQVEKSIRTPGLLKTDSDFEGAMYIAPDPMGDQSFARGNLRRGEWPAWGADSTRNDIVISQTMANALGLNPGDKVFSSYFVEGGVKIRRHRVAGIYESDFGDYDKTVVYASMAGLQSVLGIDSTECTRLDIRGIDPDHITDEALRLRSALVNAYAGGRLPGYLTVDTVERTGAMYFNWLALLDTNVAVVFVLMLCVAAFTLISCLFILILERVRMIGVLRALGMRSGAVRRIFILLTMRVVGIGMLIGNVIGLGSLLVQQYAHLIPLDPEMYYLSYVPVHINWWSMLLLNVGVAAAAWLILVVPSRMAASISPAESIKFD